jgi:hypothetical protein
VQTHTGKIKRRGNRLFQMGGAQVGGYRQTNNSLDAYPEKVRLRMQGLDYSQKYISVLWYLCHTLSQLEK